jgi:hypothetical protein
MVLMQGIRNRFGGMLSEVDLGDLVLFMLEELRMQPLTVAKLFSIKIARSWYGTECQRFETPIMLIQTAYLVLILWGSRAAWRRGVDTKQLTVGIWLITLYFWGMTALVLSILRYIVPAMGLLFVLIPGSFSNRASSLHKAN